MNSKKVLVLDDHENWRNSLSSILSDVGYVCVKAGSLLEARKMVNKEVFQLAVVDASLSISDFENRDGLNFAKSMLEMRRLEVVLIVSGYPVKEEIESFFGARENVRFLSKGDITSNYRSLITAISLLLDCPK